MKSPQEGNHSHTTACKNCVFAVWTGDTQTGCSLGRVEAFFGRGEAFEAYDKEKEFYVVKGICNTVRDSNWNDGVVSIEKVREEVKPKFLCIINATNITKNMVSELNALSVSYDVEYHIVHSFKLEKNTRELLRPLIKRLGATVTECVDEDVTIGEILMRSRRAFTVVWDHMSLLDTRLFSRVDTGLNDDLKKFVVYNLNGDVAVSNLAYHMYSKKLEAVKYSEVIAEVLDRASEFKLIVEEIEE